MDRNIKDMWVILNAGSSGGGGGDTWEETLLWENPDPNTSFGTAAFKRLGISLDEYEYVKVIYRADINSTDEMTAIGSIADLKYYREEYELSVYLAEAHMVSDITGSNAFWHRGLQMTDVASFSTGVRQGASATTRNDVVIPYKLYGIKKA